MDHPKSALNARAQKNIYVKSVPFFITNMSLNSTSKVYVKKIIFCFYVFFYLSCSILENGLEDPEKLANQKLEKDLNNIILAGIAQIPPCKPGLINEPGVWLDPNNASYYKSPYIGTLADGTTFCFGYSSNNGMGLFVTFDYPEAGRYKIQMFNDLEQGFGRRMVGGLLKQDIETISMSDLFDYEDSFAQLPDIIYPPFDISYPVCVLPGTEGQTNCVDDATSGSLRRSLMISLYSYSTGGITITCTGACNFSYPHRARIIISKEE
ncbi:hypothetical protein EHQ12_16315 [Leptospira gomenensis]|uniref:Uncharacterized protein n=1 Tax=Leptospira gomenensis TaxID=2484974 RepID=A0A5F1YA73_9LEPT|nr:hypothetical protein [Leptospira gomenensis]TGK31805.1 hypothetical protein EHQ17_13610 [Leptospira gomenensis]TGK34783.1 hypothetical protein EHQ12_16315 [Leptospira gomenensis]TGK41568.1 hypothetical protein EHQ07_15870 [Leptospira gomenensis]TGK61474.1 hypothetical protein EHQ13_09000 [Leptospira gomenensis]